MRNGIVIVGAAGRDFQYKPCLKAGFNEGAACGGGMLSGTSRHGFEGGDFFTAAAQVYLHFGKEDQKPLFHRSWEDASAYLKQDEFAAVSMRPKVEAALQFLESGWRRAIITAPESIAVAVRGGAGTEILPRVVAVERQKVTV